MALKIPTDPREKARVLRELFATPTLLPENLLAYLNDYNAVNQAAVPISQVIGSQGFLERLDANTDTVSIQSTTAETTIYSYDVPANLLQTKGAIQTEVMGTWLQNSGSPATLTLRVKYGATTLYDNTSDSVSANAETFAWTMHFSLSNRAATNSQRLIGSFTMTRSIPTSGVGGFLQVPVIPTLGTFGGSSSEDSTLKKTLAVTMQTNVSHASNSVSKLVAYTTRVAH